MIPLNLTRQSAPVEAMELTRESLPAVYAWLKRRGLILEIHASHGLMVYLDAPTSVDFGQWVTVSPTGRVEAWDRAELVAVHEGEIA